jgi:cellulose synthase/poly-beta-1,6-N-acetylglucosamine synthase-like glycosyltransferase
MEQVVWVVLAAQAILIGCFIFFAFFNYLYGLASLLKVPAKRVGHSGRPVAVVVVSYNERFVLPGTIAACEALTYPNRLVLLADDSDEPELLETLRSMAASRGCRKLTATEASDAVGRDAYATSAPPEVWESEAFVFLHRHSNDGFKGGNLREVSRYLRRRGIELMYLLDADWHPQPDCIERTLEVLEADERAAFVQTKRLTLEDRLGLFQRYVTLSEEGCYYVDFEGRQTLQHPILFSGCCALLRLDAVEAVGGFAYGHLTEDLDVTNRLWIHGWKGIYCGEVMNRGEVPFTYDDFRRQQERWACGSARCLRDYFIPILRSPHLSWIDRLSALRQNAYFSTSLLTAFSIMEGVATVFWLTFRAGTYPVEYYLSILERYQTALFATVYACVLSNLLGPIVMIVLKRRKWVELIHLPIGQWYAYSVLLTYVGGSIKGLLRLRANWFLTPKFIRGESGVWRRRPMRMRVINGGVLLLLVVSYSLEGWMFGWRDVFALLLIPAFALAVRE